MDFVNEIASLTPVGYLTTAWKVFTLIRDSIDRVEESQQQFTFLAWTIAELLRVLNEGSVPGLSGLTSTSSTINSLQELLEEIHDFVDAEGHESFIKLLVTKERRIAQIDVYQKKIAALARTFQISALLDIAKWQVKNDAAKVEDRNVLYARLDELERDRELLRKTLDAHHEDMTAMMVALQKRLDNHQDGNRERQFFSKSVSHLQTASGRLVEIQDWMVTTFDVQFMRPIASGGFGEVLSGRWQHMEVALKVLRTERGVRASSKILQKEINIWSKLRHPHILQFLGANVWGDRPFIVMPYMKNGNARDYLDHPECNRAAILHHASLGLVYLHGMNVVHADVKGLNILIEDGGRAVLCDFGLSRVKSDINSRSRDAGNEEIYGSTNWMAPERMLGGSLRKPSDIYSFGMTIYEIFTDEVPLADMHPLHFIQLVARENIRPEKPDADDSFTPEIWALAERCWAHAPSDRPSAKDICEALEQAVVPRISGSAPRHPSTPSQVPDTLALKAERPNSGKGLARQEQDKPPVLDGHADIHPVPPVDVPREIAAKGVGGEFPSRPERRQEENVSNVLGERSFAPGTSLTKPTLSFEKRRDDGQGSPLANPISTSDRKGSAPMKAASSSGTGRTLVSDEEASKGSSYARPTSSSSSSMPAAPNYQFSSDDRIVVVMGPPGSGKTTFIEYAAQQSGGSVGHGLQFQTSEIRTSRTRHPRDQGSVVFVEMPGFDDSNRSDIEILAQIAGFLVKTYKEKIPLSAILYLHQISDHRMAGSPLKNLQMLASICGQEAMPIVVIGTTMWSSIAADTGARREKELKATFWADMIAQGCTVQRFEDSYESAWKIIGKLATEAETVILSREIYDDKKNLNETAAGVKLIEELNRLIGDQKAAARRMEEQVNSQNNPALVAELQRRQGEIEEKIGGVAAQLQQLKVPTSRKIKNFFTSNKARNSGA